MFCCGAYTQRDQVTHTIQGAYADFEAAFDSDDLALAHLATPGSSSYYRSTALFAMRRAYQLTHSVRTMMDPDEKTFQALLYTKNQV